MSSLILTKSVLKAAKNRRRSRTTIVIAGLAEAGCLFLAAEWCLVLDALLFSWD